MAVYAVGDIQGCYKPLKQLLKKVEFNPAKDVLWCVGDLVNRGPDSLKVLRYLKSLGDACVCVLGNHDLHLLGQVAGESPYRRDTLQKVLDAPERDDLMDWLRYRPLLHHDEGLGWCMVHAGFPPDWTLKKCKKRAKKVEDILRGKEWMEFCRHIHAHDFPACEPKKKGLSRQLFTVAAFTRVRYCTSDGCFNWHNRSGEPGRNECAWYAHKHLAWPDDCRVIFGHWAAQGLVTNRPHVLGLDSGCVWGETLTLARLDNTKIELSSVNCPACQMP
ncbi:MAG: symmetrical bis(5'-nucleosyl)-tetraphosphatase [Mariprofundaceae bacterium]|nr:symmetrical bis(5'-nucleosyl)-tetraphosphatase [Mariprofundaceae bacterium]